MHLGKVLVPFLRALEHFQHNKVERERDQYSNSDDDQIVVIEGGQRQTRREARAGFDIQQVRSFITSAESSRLHSF